MKVATWQYRVIGLVSLYRAVRFSSHVLYLLSTTPIPAYIYTACCTNLVAGSRHVGDTAMLTFSAY